MTHSHSGFPTEVRVPVAVLVIPCASRCVKLCVASWHGRLARVGWSDRDDHGTGLRPRRM